MKPHARIPFDLVALPSPNNTDARNRLPAPSVSMKNNAENSKQANVLSVYKLAMKTVAGLKQNRTDTTKARFFFRRITILSLYRATALATKLELLIIHPHNRSKVL